MIDHNLETVQVPVGELKTYPGNARRGDLPAMDLQASLEAAEMMVDAAAEDGREEEDQA